MDKRKCERIFMKKSCVLDEGKKTREDKTQTKMHTHCFRKQTNRDISAWMLCTIYFKNSFL